MANAQAANFLGTPRELLLGAPFEKHTLPIEGDSGGKGVWRLDSSAYATGEARLADGP